MTKEFYSLEEIKKYYDKKSNTYIFIEDDEIIDVVVFNFDLDVEANIDARCIDAMNINAVDIRAWDIDAWDIDARDIDACNIDAWDIYAWDIYACNIAAENIKAKNISYFAVCFASDNIKCNSIKGRRKNAKHFVLDGKVEVENDR